MSPVSLKLTTRVGLVALLAACVPTEESRDPRGGISVRFLPSEATAGAPFTTNDGWTVTLEKTALRATSYAQGVPDASGTSYSPGGVSLPRIVDPRYDCELRVSQLFAGPAIVYVQLTTTQLQYTYNQEAEACAIDAVTRQRFTVAADDADPAASSDPWNDYDDYNTPYRYTSVETPSVYVKGFAQKDGRRLAFDLALAVTAGGLPTEDDGSYDPTKGIFTNVVTVAVDQGVPARFEVHYESLFANGIEPLANADADHDGVITAAELRTTTVPCASTNSSSSSSSGYAGGDDDDDDYSGSSRPACPTLLDRLKVQAGTIVDISLSKR